jgi:murein DD-endopeptidase MepM/ murein hydrolase activator NlpD
VLADLMSSRVYRLQVQRRTQQGARLQALVGQLETALERSDTLLRQMQKIGLIYGLAAASPEEARPRSSTAAPASIYGLAIARGEQLAALARDRLERIENLVIAARAYEEGHLDEVATTPARCPLRGRDFVVTSGFGSRRSPFTHQVEFHPGLDLAAPLGTPIMAAAAGVVTFAGSLPNRPGTSWWRYGNLVALRHADRYVTLYGHCAEVRVRVGQRVAVGEILGTVGRTGWTTSNHLHFEVRRRGAGGHFEPLDPRLFILDYSWPDEERLLAGGGRPATPGSYEELPGALAD